MWFSDLICELDNDFVLTWRGGWLFRVIRVIGVEVGCLKAVLGRGENTPEKPKKDTPEKRKEVTKLNEKQDNRNGNDWSGGLT